MSSSRLEKRLATLEAQPAATRGWRSFGTFDGVTFLETTSRVFDYRQGLIGANGEWPEFVKDKLMSREQVNQIERDGWQVLIVHWKEMSQELGVVETRDEASGEYTRR
jgi:hypothetical protein